MQGDSKMATEYPTMAQMKKLNIMLLCLGTMFLGSERITSDINLPKQRRTECEALEIRGGARGSRSNAVFTAFSRAASSVVLKCENS